MDFDRLDNLALQVAKGDMDGAGVLSTGERLYVALAANSMELLDAAGYTFAEAINRLGDDELQTLVERWRYRGDPRKF